MRQVVGSNNSYKPITNTAWVRARLCKLQKGCTELVAARDKVYQLLARGRLFSPASVTTKADRNDIAEMLLKVALKLQKSKKSNLNYTSQSLSGIIMYNIYLSIFLCFICISGISCGTVALMLFQPQSYTFNSPVCKLAEFRFQLSTGLSGTIISRISLKWDK